MMTDLPRAHPSPTPQTQSSASKPSSLGPTGPPGLKIEGRVMVVVLWRTSGRALSLSNDRVDHPSSIRSRSSS